MRQVSYNPLEDEEYIQQALSKANEIAIAFAERDLQTEESLQKVTDEISYIMKQNTVLRNQLITMSNSQVDDAQSAMEKINRANTELAAIKKNFETINTKARESQTLVKSYSTVRTVQDALANVSMAREWLARVLRLRKEVTQLMKILKFEQEYFEDNDKGGNDASDEESEEDSDEDFDATAYDLDDILIFDPENEDSMLLEVHERINQLETFRSSVFAESEEHPEFLDTFSTYLSVIDEVSDEFMRIIDRYLEKIVELAEEDPVRIVRIVRIIEREQRELLEHEERRKANPSCISIKKVSKTMKERCFEHIDKYIAQYFKFNLNDCSDLESKLERLAELCDGDLEHIERNVVPCFPKEYNIMQRYVQGYEKQIRDFLKRQIDGKLSNTDKVAMISWIHENLELFEDYKQYISEKDFSDILINLKADYLSDFNCKLQEWSEKVIAHAIKPDTKLQEDEGCVYTYAPTDFFTFLNQTISAVGATKQEELIEKIAFAVRNTLCIFKDQMLRNLLTRMDGFSKEKICAHVNDCSRCIQFTKELEEGLMEILPQASQDIFEMDEVIVGFEELAKRILNILATKTVEKLVHYFEEQFGKNWYNKNKVSSVQIAFKELTKEFEGSYLEYLEYDFIGILAQNILNKLVKLYLDGWIVKNFSLKEEEIDIVKAEIAAFKKFCGNEPWSFEALKPLEFLKDFLSIIDIEDVTEAIGDALCPKNFPDMPLFIPETIIKKCGKYKKKEQDELIATIRKFYEGWMELNKADAKKTIFSLYRMDDKGKKGFFRRGRKKVITGIQEEDKEEDIPPLATLTTATTKQSAEETVVEEIMDLDDFLNADLESNTDAGTSDKQQAEAEDGREEDATDTESDQESEKQKPARNNMARNRSNSTSSSHSESGNGSESSTRSEDKSAGESNSDESHTDESSDSSTESN